MGCEAGAASEDFPRPNGEAVFVEFLLTKETFCDMLSLIIR